ncbi:hypothetical protein [Yimella sp. RIT 621]|nr:hypothetical protein [Yimella sp. RIT 621]
MREVDEHGQRRFVVQQVLNTAWPPNARTIRPAPTGIPVQPGGEASSSST